MTSPISAAQLEQSRRDAQRLVKSSKLPAYAARDQIAQAKGFKNWSVYAKQVDNKQPKRPRRPSAHKRYYLHGDLEGDELYRCRECDVISGPAHFAAPHRTDHAERALVAIDRFYTRAKDAAPTDYRPVGAVNLFTAEMALLIEARKARKASESPFYRWFCQQDLRNDPIGDLAQEVKHDKLFPVEASLLKAQAYLENERWVSGRVLEVLQEAWTEFSASKK